MDDLKKNPFLTGYVALLVVGAGILGYFAYNAYSGYKDATQAYTSVRSSVDGLKGQDFYPNEKNQKARAEEVADFSKKVVKLEAELQPFQAERTPDLSVADLQQNIRKYIEDVRESASLAGVAITDDFRLGMATPLTFAPRKDAVPGLEYQLIAAKQLAELLIESGVVSIDSMAREELALEKPPVVVDPKAARRAASRKTKSTKKEPLVKEDAVVERFPVIATFTGDMDSIRNVVNNLAATPEGSVFFSTRLMRLENESKEGPDKDSGEKSTTGEDGEEGVESVSVILGDEVLRMQLVVDAVRFVSREEAEAAAAAAKQKKQPEA